MPLCGLGTLGRSSLTLGASTGRRRTRPDAWVGVAVGNGRMIRHVTKEASLVNQKTESGGALLKLVVACVALVLLVRVALNAAEFPTAQDSVASGERRFEPLDLSEKSELHNVFAIGERLMSGSEPTTEADFAALKEQGIETIVSVDATMPQVELAERVGLRYIHVPIGYDQVDPHAVGCLTRISKEIDGRIYLHCHHGKHRGPAAAAVLARILGTLDADSARGFLNAAGTDQDYRGLWRSVEHLQLPAENAELPPLVSQSEVDPLSDAMSRLEHALTDLAELVREDAKAVSEEPETLASADLRENWASQSLLVEEGLIEARRAVRGDADDELRKAFDQAIDEAAAMRLTAQPESEPAKPVSVSDLAEAMKVRRIKLEMSCVNCHRDWR